MKLPTVGGGVFEWHYLRPQAVLAEAVRNSPGLSDAFEAARQAKPCTPQSPWSLVVYFDELTPGNALRPDNKRKTMAIYISVRELGLHVLSHTEAWFTIGLVRTSVIKQVLGGWSRMFRDLLRAMFVGPQGLSAGGVLLPLGQPFLLFARLANVLADEAALKIAFDWKGASGMRPCLLCKNLVASGSDLAERDPTNYLVELGSPGCLRCDRASDQELWAAAEMLRSANGAMAAKQFAHLQMSLGLNWNAEGVIFDAELRGFVMPASVVTFDMMHCIFSNGTASVEAFLFLQRCKAELGIKYAHLKDFCQSDWGFPKNVRTKGRALPEVFSPSREAASSEAFKAGASEMMMTMPLLLHFAERIVEPTGKLKEELRSLYAQGEVVRAAVLAKRARAGSGSGAALAAAVELHLPLFVKAYGAESVKPKHHYTSHLAGQIDRDGGALLDAFTLERKHQAAKRSAENTDNTARFELSMLARMHLDEVRSLAPASFGDSLVGPTGEAFGLTLSEAATHKGMPFAVGDVVFVGDTAAYVCACCRDSSGSLGALVRKMQLEKRERTSSVWRRLLAMEAVDARDMVMSACWAADGDKFVVMR